MKPNILDIFTDQQTHNAMSCAGNADVPGDEYPPDSSGLPDGTPMSEPPA